MSKVNNSGKRRHVTENFKVTAELCGFGESSAMVVSKSHNPVMMDSSHDNSKKHQLTTKDVQVRVIRKITVGRFSDILG